MSAPGQKNDKFLPAISGDGVLAAHGVAEHRAKFPEHGIACLMTEPVIEELEIIYIKHDDTSVSERRVKNFKTHFQKVL